MKEKGFDEATNRYYNAQYDQIRTVSDTFMWHWNDEEFMKRVLMEGAIAIPTLQMTMKWLREERKINIEIFTYWSIQEKAVYGSRIVSVEHAANVFKEIDIAYDTYEQACEEAIKYCLENLI